jgi:hypothetical protein
MTEMNVNFLPPDRQLFRALDNLGEALLTVAKAAFPWNTANHVQRRWGFDPTTAENIAKGKGSAKSVVKAVKAEGVNGWALWDALGELIIGESRDAFDERKLQIIIQETERVRTRIEARRVRRAELEARAARLGPVGGRADHRLGV